MQSGQNPTSDVVPLLFRHAMPRTSSEDLPGHYDRHAGVWVIETKRGFVPLVESSSHAQLETSTSTRVRQEGDDEDFAGTRHLSALLETSTVTKVRQEGDDNDLSTEETPGAVRHAGMIADLATKTAEQQENDDEISASRVLELETRTLNNQEGIDEDWPRMLLELQTKTHSTVEDDDDCSLAH